MAFVACGPSTQPADDGHDMTEDVPAEDMLITDNGSPDASDARDAVAPDEGVQPSDIVDVADQGVVDAHDASDVTDVTDATDVSDVPADVEDTFDADVVRDEGPVPCEDDGLECTTETRADDGVCYSTINEGWCVIEDACVEGGTVHPENPCLECASEILDSEWSVMLDKSCDDRISCTTGDACSAEGVCAGVPVVCDDDGESCTVEACLEEDGLCHTTTLGNGANCADEGNQCTYDRCNGGVCKHTVKMAAACDDGNKCTTGDACNSLAQCIGTPKSCPDDGNVCTDNSCDPDTGSCVLVKYDDDRPCEDYNWCTLVDGCRDGVCTGDVRDCWDGDPCTFDNCVDGPAGYCENPPVLGTCEDGDLCTRGETCNAEGICQGGVEYTCDDYNICTTDSCDPDVGCVFEPNFAPCNDSDPCTDDDFCNEDKECAGTPKECGDDNDCTRDYCFMGNCHRDPQPDNIGCDDHNVCTLGGTCDSGECVSAQTLDCADSDPCTDDLCDPLSGCFTAPHVCDDNNDCTDDECVPGVGCVFTANADLCNDGDPCTEKDKCSNKVCVGTPLDCGDNDTCTLDVCTDGICSNPPNLGDCDDGNACTEGEKCFNGVCGSGIAVDCYDFSDCTTDSCDQNIGCVNTPITGACDDGTVCTLNDHCAGGECVGAVLDCDDHNFCTNDLCHPLDGCYTENNAFLCDDGNPCTTVDQCGGGTCQGQIVFRTPLMKSGTYLIGTDGNSGNGLDVDGDPGTCAPTGKCADGIDNAFAAMTLMVKDQFNPDLVTGIASGDLALFLEPELPGPVGSPFEMKVVFGELTTPTSCNPATSGCNYLAFKGDTIGSCTAKYALAASTASSHISAGGTDYQAVVYFMIGTYPMPVPLKWARVEADVTISGNNVTGGSGILAGAIDKTDFKYALSAVPEQYFIHYSRSAVILNVDQNLPMDADVDLNGVKESSTIGIKFTIVQGNVVGRTN